MRKYTGKSLTSCSVKLTFTILKINTRTMSIGYGTYQLKKDTETYTCVTDALTMGYRVIDTAALYRNELETFRAIKDFLLIHNKPRSDIIVSSKIWRYDFDPSILTDIEYLDILYLHNPMREDEENQEKWKTMNALDRNKIKKLGVSNFSLDQLKSLHPQPDAIQIEFCVLDQTMLDYCRANKIEIYVHSCIRKFKANTHYDNYQENLQQCKTWNIIPVIGAKTKEYMQINFNLMKKD